ncbi:MAG: DUF4870 domain-containing protein [Acidobacteriota bacterium]|nr:DUF4870 domain-containing protein [Acidobacteriota bacterium]
MTDDKVPPVDGSASGSDAPPPPTGGGSPPPPPPGPTQQNPSGSSAPPPPPPSGGSSGSGGGASDNRVVMLVLAYLGVLALIPLFLEKEDQEVQWHAKYGLVLFVAEIIVYIALGIISVLPLIGNVIGCAGFPLVGLAILVLHIVCIVKAINGQKVEIPVLVDFVQKF